jgi:hypothetical protein
VMSKGIVIDLKGEHVSLKALAEAALHTHDLLSELDRVVTNGTSVEWELADLKFGSAEVTAMPRLLKNSVDKTGEIVCLFREGMEMLEKAGDRPRRFNDNALKHAKALANVLNSGVSKLSFFILDGKHKSTPIHVTQRVAATVDELMESNRISYGSVEGVVEVLDGFRDSFTIFDKATRRQIRCQCDESVLDEIAARGYWKKRLIVTGRIREDRHGHAKTIKVVTYRPVQSVTELPQPEDLLGLFQKKTENAG